METTALLLMVMTVCLGPLHSEGVMFYLRDEPVGTTNSSTCLNIADVGDSVEDGVVCQSSLSHANLTSGDWYLSDGGLANSTDEENRIVMGDPRGWASDVVHTNDSDGHLLVRLWRVSESAVDGTFICDIPGDTNSPRTLYIFSPSTTGIPTNVRVTGVNATGITVNWNDPEHILLVCGDIAGYRVQWAAVSGGEVHYHEAEGLSEAHLTGLTPFTKYSIAVAAVDEEGQVVGPYSEPLIVQTDEDTPGPVVIVPVPSLVQIAITWSEPAMPNGIITDYEVSFGPKNSSRLSSAKIGLITNFSVRVELGDEFIFTVRAFTRAGAGEPTTVLVSTLTKLSVVEDVMVMSLNHSSINVSWRPLKVPYLPVTYTVVYSPVSQPHTDTELDEIRLVFPPLAVSGVITGLTAQTTYQIQVFATVTLRNGTKMEGERSNLVFFINGATEAKKNNSNSSDDNHCHESEGGVINFIGAAVGIIGIVVGISGLLIAFLTVRKKRSKAARNQRDLTPNPIYGQELERTDFVTGDEGGYIIKEPVNEDPYKLAANPIYGQELEKTDFVTGDEGGYIIKEPSVNEDPYKLAANPIYGQGASPIPKMKTLPLFVANNDSYLHGPPGTRRKGSLHVYEDVNF